MTEDLNTNVPEEDTREARLRKLIQFEGEAAEDVEAVEAVEDIEDIEDIAQPQDDREARLRELIQFEGEEPTTTEESPVVSEVDKSEQAVITQDEKGLARAPVEEERVQALMKRFGKSREDVQRVLNLYGLSTTEEPKTKEEKLAAQLMRGVPLDADLANVKMGHLGPLIAGVEQLLGSEDHKQLHEEIRKMQDEYRGKALFLGMDAQDIQEMVGETLLTMGTGTAIKATLSGAAKATARSTVKNRINLAAAEKLPELTKLGKVAQTAKSTAISASPLIALGGTTGAVYSPRGQKLEGFLTGAGINLVLPIAARGGAWATGKVVGNAINKLQKMNPKKAFNIGVEAEEKVSKNINKEKLLWNSSTKGEAIPEEALSETAKYLQISKSRIKKLAKSADITEVEATRRIIASSTKRDVFDFTKNYLTKHLALKSFGDSKVFEIAKRGRSPEDILAGLPDVRKQFGKYTAKKIEQMIGQGRIKEAKKELGQAIGKALSKRERKIATFEDAMAYLGEADKALGYNKEAMQNLWKDYKIFKGMEEAAKKNVPASLPRTSLLDRVFKSVSAAQHVMDDISARWGIDVDLTNLKVNNKLAVYNRDSTALINERVVPFVRKFKDTIAKLDDWDQDAFYKYMDTGKESVLNKLPTNTKNTAKVLAKELRELWTEGPDSLKTYLEKAGMKLDEKKFYIMHQPLNVDNATKVINDTLQEFMPELKSYKIPNFKDLYNDSAEFAVLVDSLQDVAKMPITDATQLTTAINKAVGKIPIDGKLSNYTRNNKALRSVVEALGEYVPAVDTPKKFRLAFSNFLEDVSTESSELGIRNFKQKLKADPYFKDFVRSVEYLNGEPVESIGKLIKSIDSININRRDVVTRLSPVARAAMRRGKLRQIPFLIREKDPGKLLTSWVNNTMKAAYLRDDVAALMRNVEILEKIGRTRQDKNLASADAQFLKEHVHKMLNYDEGGFMAKNVYGPIGDRYSKWVVRTKDPKSMDMWLELPSVLNQSFRNVMYGGFLASPKAFVRNLEQTSVLTAEEIGGEYARALNMRAQFTTATSFKDILALLKSSDKVSDARMQRLAKTGKMPSDIKAEIRHVKDSVAPSGLRTIESVTDAYASGTTFLFQLSDKINRWNTVKMANYVVDDALVGNQQAIKFITEGISSPTVRRKAAEALEKGNKGKLNNLVEDYLLQKTQFVYNTNNMSKLARNLGPALAMFSRWPTEVTGDLMLRFKQGNADKALEKYLRPLFNGMLLDQYIQIVSEYNPDFEARVKGLIGVGGFTARAPVLSLFSWDVRESAPVIVDLMSTLIDTIITGDRRATSRLMNTYGRNIVPYSKSLEGWIDDFFVRGLKGEDYGPMREIFEEYISDPAVEEYTGGRGEINEEVSAGSDILRSLMYSP